jgi:hypothetical protein
MWREKCLAATGDQGVSAQHDDLCKCFPGFLVCVCRHAEFDTFVRDVGLFIAHILDLPKS